MVSGGYAVFGEGRVDDEFEADVGIGLDGIPQGLVFDKAECWAWADYRPPMNT
jgi:hypothetical protein